MSKRSGRTLVSPSWLNRRPQNSIHILVRLACATTKVHQGPHSAPGASTCGKRAAHTGEVVLAIAPVDAGIVREMIENSGRIIGHHLVRLFACHIGTEIFEQPLQGDRKSVV